MPKIKRNLFAVLGAVVWKLLAVLGVKAAKDKIAAHRSEERPA